LAVREQQPRRQQALGADEMIDTVAYDAESLPGAARLPHAWLRHVTGLERDRV